jgi:hypothetical protein
LSSCAKRAAKLLRHRDGRSMYQLQHAMGLTAIACRTALHEIIAQGGEIEVLAVDSRGRPILHLDN